MRKSGDLFARIPHCLPRLVEREAGGARLSFYAAPMALLRMDNVAIVVEDLDAAVAFFSELGLEVEGRAEIEGVWADQTVGLDGVRSTIVMMRTPDGRGRLELTKYDTPDVVRSDPPAPAANTVGLHRIMFAVDDLDDTLARLREHGGEVLREVAQYEDLYRLCYLRGPAGIIVALAEQLGNSEVQ